MEDNMQKVIMNGVPYIGVLKEAEGVTNLVDALQVGGGVVQREEIATYLRMKNTGTLEAIQFGGTGVAYSVSEFTDAEQMDMDMCAVAMKHAKKTAVAGMENQAFDILMGK